MGSVYLRRDPPVSSNIPSWVDSRQRSIVLTCIITPIFTTIFVVLRLYARKFITKQVGWDDWVAAFTLVLCLVYSVLLSLWTQHGGGMHQADLQHLGMLEGYYQWIEISSPIYILACLGYKISILLLYLRLFSLHRLTIYATYFTLLLTTAYLFSNFIVQFTGCHPISKFWNPTLPGTCIDFVSSDIGFGSLNVISDFLIFILPLPALWRSTLSFKDKWGATLVFLTGAVAFVAALVRFQFAIKDLTAEDRTYLAGLAFLWMVIEVNTGLICSCGPALKPLYRKVFAPEMLERYAPRPVKHALNGARERPRSVWRIEGEVDSQATLTENGTAGGGNMQYKSPWMEAAGRPGKQGGLEIELQDVGGILSAEKLVEEKQMGGRTQRAGSDAPTVVEDGDEKMGQERSTEQDSPTAFVRRQASFV